MTLANWLELLSKASSGEMDLPSMGVLATRTPYRPNPIGLTVVELLERKGNILTVKGLDALDGASRLVEEAAQRLIV